MIGLAATAEVDWTTKVPFPSPTAPIPTAPITVSVVVMMVPVEIVNPAPLPTTRPLRACVDAPTVPNAVVTVERFTAP